MSDSLDLTKLISAHALSSLLACVSVNPQYNLAISLFGLYAASAAENGGRTEAVKQFCFLLFISLVLDIIVRLSSSPLPAPPRPSKFVLMLLVLRPILAVARCLEVAVIRLHCIPSHFQPLAQGA